MKKYILDTSVLVHSPSSFKTFDDSEVILPVTVLDELDKLKKYPGEAGRNARVAIRLLDDISNQGDITVGVKVGTVTLRIDAGIYPNEFGDTLYGDTRILSCTFHTKAKFPKDEIIFVSNDINLRVRAKSLGIKSESYNKDKTETNEIYSGLQVINDPLAGSDLITQDIIDPKSYGLKLSPNECVMFTDENGDDIALGRLNSEGVIQYIDRNFPWGISCRNKEQKAAVDLILDPNIPLITLIGQAGTGKSLITLASALELVLDRHEYEKFIIYRPIQAVGNDIGYLPGPQPLDAKILTPNGWSIMGNIQPDDYVIGSDGNPKKVLKIFPKGEKEVFKVTFSDGSSTECCEDHLWHTTTLQESQRKDSAGSVKSLKEIRETLKAYTSNVNNHKVKLIKPVSFVENEVLINPYIMGVLLGDGTLSEEYSVYFTSSDEQMMTNCQSLLPENMLCKVKSKTKDSYNYSFIAKNNLNRKHREDNVFAAEIKRLGLTGSKSGTKFIPEKYKINSVNNRLSILQGLMDADGFVSKDGADVSYSTTSNQLAEDVQFLVQSLGGIAKINKKKSYYTYNDVKKELLSNVVSISLPNDLCPFRLNRKINRFKSRKYDLSRMITDVSTIGFKETKCILVESEDHLYATDDFILTHNTMEEKLAPWFQAVMDNFEVLFTMSNGDKWRANFEAVRKKDRIQMEAITYIRGRSIPNAVILIDEAQNLSKDDIKTILTRAGENTKIILTGDLDQIDNSSLDAMNNGLAYVIEKFKDSELAGHITFTKGERSVLATEAAKIL